MKYDLDILRTRNNLTMKQMADILDISFNTYKSKKEKIINLNIAELNKCSNYFKIPMDTLMGFSNNLEFNIISREIDYNHLHYYLKFFRKRNKQTIKELADILNVSYGTINNLKYQTTTIKVILLKSFCQNYQISMDFLCGKSFDRMIK